MVVCERCSEGSTITRRIRWNTKYYRWCKSSFQKKKLTWRMAHPVPPPTLSILTVEARGRGKSIRRCTSRSLSLIWTEFEKAPAVTSAFISIGWTPTASAYAANAWNYIKLNTNTWIWMKWNGYELSLTWRPTTVSWVDMNPPSLLRCFESQRTIQRASAMSFLLPSLTKLKRAYAVISTLKAGPLPSF